jgi:hypothetical protein
MLDQRRRREIPENLCAGGDTLLLKAVAGDPVGHSSELLS